MISGLAICGHSGSGKTTLIERLLPPLRALGWRVAVVKRTRHEVVVDVAGKDSDRFFRAGATVCLHAHGETFRRAAAPASDGEAWARTLHALAVDHDFVLIEGHKETPLPKVWLLGPGEEAPPPATSNVLLTLGGDDERPQRVGALCRERATRALAERPLFGAVLLDRGDRGAAAARAALARWCARTVMVGGDGLPPVPEITPPGLAHTLAALRWAPDAAWIAVRPGPGLTSEVLAEMLARRQPGRWVVEATAGVDAILHEPQARVALEDAARSG